MAKLNRPHASLWLAKTYVVPAGMYASQMWGTGFMQASKEFSSALQTLHKNFLKGTLGVKQTTTNWAVLRECGHQLLQMEPLCVTSVLAIELERPATRRLAKRPG
eukprot:1161999-Pelagomonas_calceolata.AAC.4